MRLTVVIAAALLLGLVAWDFVAATTFVGDDYLFLAFARLEPNPLLAFVRDMHGGEYYRPLPMLLWWLLNRAGQGSKRQVNCRADERTHKVRNERRLSVRGQASNCQAGGCKINRVSGQR